jgi:hypothetical protein
VISFNIREVAPAIREADKAFRLLDALADDEFLAMWHGLSVPDRRELNAVICKLSFDAYGMKLKMARLLVGSR